MKRLMAAITAAILFQGCGGPVLYPDTDVVEPKDFGDPVAQGVQKSGGLMQAGSLEYSGSGDLVPIYREYVAQMKAHGWTGAEEEIQAKKAVGKLRKDNRTCALEFTSNGGTIKISIKVSQTK